MYCKKCGHPIEENSMFCNVCGAQLKPENITTPIEEQSNNAEGQTEPLFGASDPGNAGQGAPSRTFKQPAFINNAPELKLKYEKKKSKLPFIITIALVLVIGAVAATLFGVSTLNTKKYDELIDTGSKYLEEMKYEEARREIPRRD